jgi:hypothetical protein
VWRDPRDAVQPQGWRALFGMPGAPVRPKDSRQPTREVVAAARAAWAAASAAFLTGSGGEGALSGSLRRYGPETWEHACRLDHWARAVAYGTWLLEWALSPAATAGTASAAVPDPSGEGPFDVGATLEAAAVLEDALAAQLEDRIAVAGATYKNLGLAYVRLVRGGARFPRDGRWPCVPGADPAAVCAAGTRTEEAARVAAARRVLDTWGHFLALPEAKADPGHATMVSVVETLRGALAGRGAAGGKR